MSPKELAYVETLFFKGFKIIKNMHTMEHWFCVCQGLKKDTAVSVNFRTDLIYGV